MDRGLNHAGALCELPRLFCGNSHSGAAFNFCPDIRVHGLPQRLGEAPAAPIVRVASSRGLGSWCKNRNIFSDKLFFARNLPAATFFLARFLPVAPAKT